MLRKMFCFNACLRTRTFDRSGVSVPLESLNGSKPNWRTLNGALNFPISNCGGGPGAMSRNLCVWVCVWWLSMCGDRIVGELGYVRLAHCRGGGIGNFGLDAENQTKGRREERGRKNMSYAVAFFLCVLPIFYFSRSFLTQSRYYCGYKTSNRYIQTATFVPMYLFCCSPRLWCRTIHHRFSQPHTP